MTTECCVCLETYQADGARCPKLLPCSHTVCLSCLEQLAGDGYSQIKCPECRTFCPLPQGGAEAFPTNRYVLTNLQLAQRINQLETSQEQPVVRSTNGNDEGPTQSTDNERDSSNDHADAIVSHILQVAEYIRDEGGIPDSRITRAAGEIPDGTSDMPRDGITDETDNETGNCDTLGTTNGEIEEIPTVHPRATQNETVVELDVGVEESESSTNGNPNLVNVESRCTRFRNDMRQFFCSFKQFLTASFESCSNITVEHIRHCLHSTRHCLITCFQGCRKCFDIFCNKDCLKCWGPCLFFGFVLLMFIFINFPYLFLP